MADDRTAPAPDIPGVGRVADVHMWTIRGGWTSRLQAFRDESGRTFVMTTWRSGDQGIGPFNGAGMFLADAWAEFFPAEKTAPTLVANVMLWGGVPEVVTLCFDDCGEFDSHCATDPDDIETLNRLGAEWDAGSGFVPYVPPAPTRVVVWRLFPVSELPERRLFRDMAEYLLADWGQAVAAACAVLEANDIDVLDGVPADVAAAARTLLGEPVELGRKDGRVSFINGQHRTEAMRRQGVEKAVLRDRRGIDDSPFDGEFGPVMYVS